MRYLSLFSGIEAASVAWKDLGWEAAAFSEIEPFPCAVLKHHYPDVPNLGDITKITEAQIKALGNVDLVVGGSPCQDVSIAGKRKGFHDSEGAKTRSGLFYDYIRIIGYLRKHCGLRFALLENVPGLFSSNKGEDFATVVGELVGADFSAPTKGWQKEGAAVGPFGLLEWACLDAQWFGVPQRRKRVFALADFGDWSNRPPILLESKSVSGDTPPRRETRQGITSSTEASIGSNVAPTISARTKGGGGLGTDFDCDGGLVVAIQERAICENAAAGPDGMGCKTDGTSYTLEARNTVQAIAYGGGNSEAIDVATTTTAHERWDFESETFIAHALRAEGFDASEDGTGRGTPLVPLPVPYDLFQITAPINKQNRKEGDPCHTLSKANAAAAAAVAYDLRDREDGAQFEGSHDTANIYAANGGSSRSYVAYTAVRRLTPRECEKLQGFSSDYTLIPVGKKRIGDPRTGIPRLSADGPRYKALGNSFAVPVVRWIGERIAAFS